MADALPRNEKIATYVRKAIKAGVSIKDIMGSIQKYQFAPKSTNGLYKVYGQDIAASRAKVVEEIGSMVIQQAKDGHFDSQKFYLQSKGGWSPNSTVNEVESDGEGADGEAAVDTLMTLLGKNNQQNEKD